jgi:hypothetical protein
MVVTHPPAATQPSHICFEQYCRRRFNGKSALEKHRRDTGHRKTWTCEYSPDMFALESDPNGHEDASKFFACLHCSRFFTFKQGRNRHTVDIHSYPCLQCMTGFRGKRELEAHQFITAGLCMRGSSTRHPVVPPVCRSPKHFEPVPIYKDPVYLKRSYSVSLQNPVTFTPDPAFVSAPPIPKPIKCKQCPKERPGFESPSHLLDHETKYHTFAFDEDVSDSLTLDSKAKPATHKQTQHLLPVQSTCNLCGVKFSTPEEKMYHLTAEGIHRFSCHFKPCRDEGLPAFQTRGYLDSHIRNCHWVPGLIYRHVSVL